MCSATPGSGASPSAKEARSSLARTCRSFSSRGVDTVYLQSASKLGETTTNVAFHRAERQARHAGDLTVTQVVEEREFEHAPLRLGQVREAVGHHDPVDDLVGVRGQRGTRLVLGELRRRVGGLAFSFEDQ